MFHVRSNFYFQENQKYHNGHICRLNAIKEDLIQLKFQKGNVIAWKGKHQITEQLFSIFGDDQLQIPEDVLNWEFSIIFAHVKALLSKEGCKLYSRKSLSGECTFL